MPAILALPDIGLMLAGVFLLVLAYALYILRDLIVGAFSHVPVIGGWIGSSLGGLLDDARDAVLSGARSSFGGAETLFKAAAHWATRMFDEVISSAADLAVTVEHIATSQIPRAVDAVRTFIINRAESVYHQALRWYHDGLAFTRRQVAGVEHDLTGVRHWAAQTFDDVRHDLAADVGAVRHDLTAGLDAARAFTDQEIQQVTSWAGREISAAAAAAESFASGLFAAAEQDIGAALRAAEAAAAADATAAAHAARVAVDVAASAGLAIPWSGIITDLDNLDQTIGQAWRDIRDAVDAIPRAVPADLAGVVSALGALAIPMLRAMDDCVLPQCRDLGGLRSFLSDLLSAASAAAMLAWLVFCVVDPVAAADDTYTAGGPVARDTLGALEGLFGVHT